MGVLFILDPDDRLTVIWTHSHNNVQDWYYVLIPVSYEGNFTIVIEAERGTSKDTDIFIDDISFTQVMS